MSSSQADLTKFTWIYNASAAALVAPTDGPGGTSPAYTMSPVAISKMPTTGLLLMIKRSAILPAATPIAGGFSIVVWLRDPTSFQWAAFAAVTVDFDQLFVTYDIDAGELYFQVGGISADGSITFGLAEQ